MNRMSRLALLNSEVFQELETMTKTASLSDKIISSPVAQKAISDGITKALQSSDDDGAMETAHATIKQHLSKLTDHELFEMFKIFATAVKERGMDMSYEEEFEDAEANETPDDEDAEEEDMETVLAFVKSSLTKLAYDSADEGNTVAAYLIEKCISKLE